MNIRHVVTEVYGCATNNEIVVKGFIYYFNEIK